jgi:hypothetical protein
MEKVNEAGSCASLRYQELNGFAALGLLFGCVCYQSLDALLPLSWLPSVAPALRLQCAQMMRSPGVPPPPRTTGTLWSRSMRFGSVISPSHLCVHPPMPHGHHVPIA